MMSRFASYAAAAAVALAAFAGPSAAAWPEKPIRVVVPFGPGGTSDQTARIFARAIEQEKLLPQPLTVVNVGGHFSIGSRQVMEAPADGHNFLLVHIALMGGEAAKLMNFGYRDFAPVAATSEFCLVPVVMQSSPYKSLKELLTAAKEKPDSIVFGVNLGAINHMAGIMLEDSLPGAKFRFVQIGGGSENYAALKGGTTMAGVLSSAEYNNFHTGGLRGLAYTGPQEIPELSGIKTAKALGYDVEFCVTNWWFAPKNTPKVAIDGLADALEGAMKTAYIQKELKDRLFGPVFLKGEAYRKSLDDTYKRIEPIALKATKK